MNNKDKNKISHLLKNGESVYVYYWEDDIVVRYQYVNKELMCYPKGKGVSQKSSSLMRTPMHKMLLS